MVCARHDFFHHLAWSFLFAQKAENLVDNIWQDVPHGILAGVFSYLLSLFFWFVLGWPKLILEWNLCSWPSFLMKLEVLMLVLLLSHENWMIWHFFRRVDERVVSFFVLIWVADHCRNETYGVNWKLSSLRIEKHKKLWLRQSYHQAKIFNIIKINPHANNWLKAEKIKSPALVPALYENMNTLECFSKKLSW